MDKRPFEQSRGLIGCLCLNANSRWRPISRWFVAWEASGQWPTTSEIGLFKLILNVAQLLLKWDKHLAMTPENRGRNLLFPSIWGAVFRRLICPHPLKPSVIQHSLVTVDCLETIRKRNRCEFLASFITLNFLVKVILFFLVAKIAHLRGNPSLRIFFSVECSLISATLLI